MIPKISIIMGPCVEAARSTSTAVTDFIFMTEKTSYMFITGPQVIKQVTSEEIDPESLGGAKVHGRVSGSAISTTPLKKRPWPRSRTPFLPPGQQPSRPPVAPTTIRWTGSSLNWTVIPESSRRPYDMKKIIVPVLDNRHFWRSTRTTPATLSPVSDGLAERTVGIVANQPNWLAGCLDTEASVKCARFVRFCDAFNIPLWTLLDVPGYLPAPSRSTEGSSSMAQRSSMRTRKPRCPRSLL